MPLSLNSHRDRTRQVAVTFPDYADDPSKVLNVTYRPRGFEEFARSNEANDRYWKRRDREIEAIPDELDRADALAATNDERDRSAAHILLPIIAGWDLYYDNEQTQPVPVDEDAMIALGLMSLMAIVTAIIEDMRPNPNGLSASGEPSSPGASEPTQLQVVT